eukprot:gnl/Trimastix_PCT/915.p2 GENE.gnl/Trimastix_PCT/915~~gnl/Trimastix_PCT/915.p2  ORF type:complete len:304 (+),score=77.28 gnl/Trimastix_PCT/915:76-987(+)
MPKVRSERPQMGFVPGLELSHARGQHLLRNPAIVDQIIEKSGLRATDIVLEIGPGTGNLTMRMLPLVSKVIAYEIDPRMVVELKKRVQGTEFERKLELIHGDVIKAELPFFSICVANTPYQISSPLTFKLLAHRPQFRAAILMFQKEFAERLYARPGSELYCRLSVNTQLLARVDHLIKVGRNNFRPPPKVDSAVVRIEPRHPAPQINFKEWDGLTRLCFLRKNKTLASIFRLKKVAEQLEQNFRNYCAHKNIPLPNPMPSVKDVAVQVLSQAGLAEQRGSKLTTQDFAGLLERLNQAGVYFT